MDAFMSSFRVAFKNQDGYGIAALLMPDHADGDLGPLYAFYGSSNVVKIQNDIRSALIYRGDVDFTGDEAKAWVDLFQQYWTALGELLPLQDTPNGQKRGNSTWSTAYSLWSSFTKCLWTGFQRSTFPYWAVPCLVIGAKYLRILALKVDEMSIQRRGLSTYSHGPQDELDFVSGQNKTEPKLAEAARTIMSIFSACSSDRAPIEESRKWGLYAVANVQFKVYFQLNNMKLCKTLIRSLTVAEPPPLNQFPMAHQVTFNYYMGVTSFLEEDYAKAEEYLQSAWQKCHPSSNKNKTLVLTYLVSCRLITSHKLPTQELLAPFPQLASVFLPLASAIKRASLYDFDVALQAGEQYFVKRRIYLTLERARDIALRNLFRKVYIAGGFEPLKEDEDDSRRTRRTRIPIEEFIAAVRLSAATSRTGEDIDRDEVECLLANMIYKNLMKGYIHRERAILVLSKGQPFPGTAT